MPIDAVVALLPAGKRKFGIDETEETTRSIRMASLGDRRTKNQVTLMRNETLDPICPKPQELAGRNR